MRPGVQSVVGCSGLRPGLGGRAIGRVARVSAGFPCGLHSCQPRLPTVRKLRIRPGSNQDGVARLEPCHASSSSLPLPPFGGVQSIQSSIKKQLSSFTRLWKTFLPMCTLFFFMAFINTIVSSLGLTLIITSPGGGAQVLPFLTVYAALPASLLFMVLYSYASHYMERRKVFNLIISAFGIFNVLFILFLYPIHDAVHLHGTAAYLSQVLPSGLSGAVGMIRNWTFTLFYCASELWGDVGLSLLFWGFANEVTSVKDAPVVYPLFGIGANLAQMLGGVVLRGVSSGGDFALTLQRLIFLVIGCKVAVIVLHNLILSRGQKTNSGLGQGPRDKNIEGINVSKKVDEVNAKRGSRIQKGRQRRDLPDLKKRDFVSRRADHQVGRPPPKAPDIGRGASKKPTLKSAFKTLSESPEIRALGIITLAQSLAVNLMEFVWKSHLRVAYPSPAAFTSFMGDVSTITGFITGALMFVSPILFDQLGWEDVAGVTPKILFFGGICFFGTGIGYQIFARFGMVGACQGLLSLTVLGGALLYVIARGVRFSLFKPAEEMVYIRLDKESQTKGKAAVDVVGAQTGKSGGSILQQCLLLLSGGSLLYVMPIMYMVYVAMLIVWQQAVSRLAVHQAKAVESSTGQNSSPVTKLSVPPLVEVSEAGKSGDDQSRPYTLTAPAIAG